MKGKEDPVSAIVVNYNGGAYLDDCLSSLFKQSHDNLEVILVDNASSDGSVEHVRDKFPEVRVIENERNIGYGAAVNRGVAAARGSFIIFLSFDLRLKEDCISQLACLAQEEGIGGVQPKLLDAYQPDLLNSYGHVLTYVGMTSCRYIYERDRADLKEEEIPSGNHFLVRRKLFQELGGFDEGIFLYYEDIDLSWRIRLTGKKIIITPKAIMYHAYDYWRNPAKFSDSEKARIIMLLKNYGLKTLLLILPAALLVEVAKIFYDLAQGRFGKKVKGYGEIISSFPAILEKRQGIQRTRRIADREITALFASRISAVPGTMSTVESHLINWFLNVPLALYWRLIKRII